MPPGGNRRRGRVYALQILYAVDSGAEDPPASAVDAYREHFGAELKDDVVSFATVLVKRASEGLAQVDDVIGQCSRNWRLDRMGRVDRNILRLATSELLWGNDVPTKVVINEAVELAKSFGTGESAAFVNGILDRVAQKARP